MSETRPDIPTRLFTWLGALESQQRLLWGAATVVVMGILMLWFTLPLARTWSEKADTIEQVLKESAAKRDQLLGNRDTIVAHGPSRPLPLVRSDAASDQMANAINDIINRHSGVTGYRFDDRGESRIKEGPLSQIAVGTQRAVRLGAEVQFDAAFTDAAVIVREIEDSPLVDSIGSLSMQRVDDSRAQKVTLRMTVYAWAISDDDARKTKRG